jgi:hypothetical protein
MRPLMFESTLEWADLRDRRATVPQHVVWRGFAAETVLLNINTGMYHGLDEVSGRFFEVLREAPTVAAAITILVAEYEQPEERVQEDMVHFCGELQGLGLIDFTA